MIHIQVDFNDQTQDLRLTSNVSPEVSVQVLHQAYIKALIDTVLAQVAAQQRRIIRPLDN